jgi:hypothetical protein
MAMGHSFMPHTGCYNTFHARKVDSALCQNFDEVSPGAVMRLATGSRAVLATLGIRTTEIAANREMMPDKRPCCQSPLFWVKARAGACSSRGALQDDRGHA